ncbi:hypothetical protein P7C70_g9155, partial [Phenoliferia sp. Uapishka_3]
MTPSFASPKVTEGFYVPSDTTSLSTERFGYGVDPSFIFSASAAYPPTSISALSHLNNSHKPTTLSDLDLGFDDSSFGLPSSLPFASHGTTTSNAQHHSFGAGGGVGTGGGSYLGGGGIGGIGGAGAFDDFGYRQQQSSAAMYESLSQRSGINPATSIPHYLSNSQQQRISIPSFAATTSSSTRDSRSPSATSAGTDLFALNNNPLDSPDTNNYGSYSSIGESIPPPSSTTTTTAPTSIIPPSASKRRTTSTDRSRSTGVGKAPTSSTRSRSARRTATTTGSYQPPGSGSIASPSAMSIPSPSAGPSTTSSSTHQLAMSMPAYPNGGAPGSPWFASAHAIAFSHAQSPAEEKESPMESNGWRPSALQNGPAVVPASAPVSGSKKKVLDNVPEDPTKQ